MSSGSSYTGSEPEVIFEPSAGAVLSDRYVLESAVEQGAAGVVWRGRHAAIGKRVAIKILKAEHARDEDDWAIKRMLREARLLSQIQHPSVVDVLDFGEQGGCPYIVMELLEGRTLAKALREDGAIPWDRAAVLIEQMIEGLDAAHRVGVIHRDLKPANIILVRADSRAKLIDFGIAGARGRTRITMDGEVLGTPHFMSPEQSRTMDLTATSDIYSFGCVVFAMLAGRPPYVGKIAEIVRQHVKGPVPAVSQLVGPDVPRDVCLAIQRCMAKNPDERFQSMSEVHHAMLGRPLGTSRALITARTRARGRSRKRGVVTAVAAGGAFALSLAAGAMVLWNPWEDSGATAPAAEPRPAAAAGVQPEPVADPEIPAASEAAQRPAPEPEPEPELPVEVAKPKHVDAPPEPEPAGSARPRRPKRPTSKPDAEVSQPSEPAPEPEAAPTPTPEPPPPQPKPDVVEKVGGLKNPFDAE
ncbi:MAG: serine/threonine-protein kinase [Nannocystaceae bacterium]|nr:serine/threonine protein kinase [bacterium]